MAAVQQQQQGGGVPELLARFLKLQEQRSRCYGTFRFAFKTFLENRWVWVDGTVDGGSGGGRGGRCCGGAVYVAPAGQWGKP